MYNTTTEQKITSIPSIGTIDISRLPQELTRIYAQIVSLRHQVVDGRINFQDESLLSGLTLLRSLANNLETILLTDSYREHKEAIAFVSATANSLIHKMGLQFEKTETHFEIDSISSYVATIVMFLIGNSQADAAEVALSTDISNVENITQQRLIASIISLATGKFSNIDDVNFNEKEVVQKSDFEQTALNLLWRELGLGIVNISKRLIGQSTQEKHNHFDKVLELSISESGIFDFKSAFSGPYRLARLLKLLEADIFNRSIMNIDSPSGVDPTAWQVFLEKLAKTRPYLWENHRQAVDTDFLNPGVSAVLTLPTGAGKSTLSELKIASSLYSNKKVIYLVPTHALEDQVNNSLKSLFTEFEPLNFELGSEYTEFEDPDNFPILVATPERCLTLINIDPDFFSTVGLIVFDEFHLIHGVDIKKDRRSIDAMYCLLSLFNNCPNADYLLISAMVENGAEIASWIETVTKRKCKLFNSTWKPTRQLHGCLVFEEDSANELTQHINRTRIISTTKGPSTKLKDEMSIEPKCFFSLKNIWETTEDGDYFLTTILDHNVLLGIGTSWQLTSNRNKIASDLAIHFSKLGLKTLVFVDSPRITNSTSRDISNAIGNQSENYDDYVSRNKSLVNSLELELGSIDHSYFHDCTSVGVHHGLLLPIERSLIEEYFKKSNGLQVLVATATLAQGINLPAEIVIIAGDDRYDEDGENRQRVDPHELLNAAGRAGRAGLSAQGAVILIPGDIVTIKDFTISDRWWDLKNEVFSKGDQCLNIEDPLGHFLDTLTDDLSGLNAEQINTLYRFKPQSIFSDDIRKTISKSFRAYQAAEAGNTDHFETQVHKLLDLRTELNDRSAEDEWQKIIALKNGVDPSVIFELDQALSITEILDPFPESISEWVEWFFKLLEDSNYLMVKIFTKDSTINQIKKAVGLKPNRPLSEVRSNLPVLVNCLQSYISGAPLNVINEQIPDVSQADNSGYLIKARNFVNRLVPELSFAFGLLSMVLTERFRIEGGNKEDLTLDIKVMASCIREGFDSSEKLYFKKNAGLKMRVETHIEFEK